MKKFVFIALFFIMFTVLPAGVRAEEKGVRVPILMYHHITVSASRQNTYTVMREEFESDIKYLKENGYNFLLMRDLIGYVNGETKLPEKPVVVTFDDGYLSFYRYAYETLKKYGAKAVLSIIGIWTERYTESGESNVNFTHVTWDQISEMRSSGLVEIQNHTYDMHRQKPRRGIMRLPSETVECYRNTLFEDVDCLQQKLIENCGFAPDTFTYPFGFIGREGEQVIKELGFAASLSCYERISRLNKKDPECLYNLGRFNRVGGADFKNLMTKIENAL